MSIKEALPQFVRVWFKEAVNNLDEFWQRQVFKFEALVLSIVILWFKPITKKLGTWLSPGVSL